jgi:hypothetical protein
MEYLACVEESNNLGIISEILVSEEHQTGLDTVFFLRSFGEIIHLADFCHHDVEPLGLVHNRRKFLESLTIEDGSTTFL